MEGISDQIKNIERNIEIVSKDPIALHGFTQVPNFLFKPITDKKGSVVKLKPQDRFVYAKFLSYAWHNDCVFPGQERMAEDLDMSRTSVTASIKVLAGAGLIEITRRGQGRTNLYKLNFWVAPKSKGGAKNKD